MPISQAPGIEETTPDSQTLDQSWESPSCQASARSDGARTLTTAATRLPGLLWEA